ncbi:hypothetical protein [Streptomyces sp. 1331.2]|uniref:hypothetical protein n=1 Tax=Streptomyces sp. 1331.2 TaxID=1938835 RepID=UPI000BD38890|nr:hypothetical protein [Streptomyces sp. 1331.2]SOB83127.1 hypothetical protein SAMN06272789_3325 [Streptomyces sp. 1331.2]
MTDATRRTIRTGLQTLLGLLAALPLLVDTAGIPHALPGVAVALTVAGAITRLMALPVVERLLPAWLRTPTDEGTIE